MTGLPLLHGEYGEYALPDLCVCVNRGRQWLFRICTVQCETSDVTYRISNRAGTRKAAVLCQYLAGLVP